MLKEILMILSKSVRACFKKGFVSSFFCWKSKKIILPSSTSNIEGNFTSRKKKQITKLLISSAIFWRIRTNINSISSIKSRIRSISWKLPFIKMPFISTIKWKKTIRSTKTRLISWEKRQKWFLIWNRSLNTSRMS